jgi:KDEL-tailed cysteine endopeptidase
MEKAKGGSVSVSSFSSVAKNSSSELKAAIAKTVVSVAIQADKTVFT